MTAPEDLVIIGGGPAGYTAAIYAGRAGLEPVVVEGTPSGGALMQTTDVENFPGFVEGVPGPELMDLLRKQPQRYGAQLVTADATAIALAAEALPVHRVDVDTAGYEARALILAMGSSYPATQDPRRSTPSRSRRVVVRNLRRVLLPQPAHSRHRRRRLRAARSHLPDSVCSERYHRSPPRFPARIKHHAAACFCRS
jgi:phytoene dehydrogenase-like protein